MSIIRIRPNKSETGSSVHICLITIRREMRIYTFLNAVSAKTRFLNLGSNPNLTKTKLSGLNLNPIPHIQVGSDPGSFSLLVSSFINTESSLQLFTSYSQAKDNEKIVLFSFKTVYKSGLK